MFNNKKSQERSIILKLILYLAVAIALAFVMWQAKDVILAHISDLLK